MTRLFNAYVMVDWSAAQTAKTGKDSVWIGMVKRDIRFRPSFESWNPPTRAEAETRLREILADLRRRNERALIGFDFNLGYPRGLGAALQLKDPSWAGVWSFLAANVVDKKDNTNNRFAVAAKMNRLMTDQPWPFWGCPPKDAQRWLTPTKPPETVADGLPVYRHAEAVTHAAGKAQAKPAWQLMGAGSVGGQVIVGIPAVRRLAEELGDKATVWPFTTGWKELKDADLEGKEAVLAEVYPSLIPSKPEGNEAPDLAQVRALCEHFYKLDEAGKLGPLFAAPKDAGEDLIKDVETEEGWILGV